jgi:hypothetical protein
VERRFSPQLTSNPYSWTTIFSANVKVLYGTNRNFDVVTVGSEKQKHTGVALVELMGDGRSFVHIYVLTPAGGTRIAALKQILSTTEENLQPIFGNLNVTQGWIQCVMPGTSNGVAA